MLVEIIGMGQGSIAVELQMVPRKGESVNHYINQHADEHKIQIKIRPFNYLITA
ncbi:hypothetical protein ACG9ZB_02245 [Acinetobacter johnsonii]|uniref:hypothetical protein n=1 Tax=Acinetobacter johnsonii TaxID=40214 RepID=UPI003AF58236